LQVTIGLFNQKIAVMKTFKFFLIPAMLFFLAGCVKDTAVPADAEALEFRAPESVTVPMKVWVEESYVNEELPRKPCDIPGPTIPAGGWMRGHATHLGTFNVQESTWEHGVCNVYPSENKLVITGSEGIFAGANGEQIWWKGDYEVFFTGGYSVDMNIVGGTGRFESATGTLHGYSDGSGAYGSGYAEGWITIYK
jgi:hypothetical protein